MKRWVVRLSVLTAVVALGWFTVAWAQRQDGPEEANATGPDYSKPPVNSEAFETVGAGHGATPSSGAVVTPVSVNADTSTTSPADPFQGVRSPIGGRYQNFEPKTINPDPNAQSLATATSEIATAQASHHEPANRYATSQNLNSSDATDASPTAGSADESANPVDPFSAKRARTPTESAAGKTDLTHQPANADPQQAGSDDLSSNRNSPLPGLAAAASGAAVESTPPSGLDRLDRPAHSNPGSGRYSNASMPESHSPRNPASDSLLGNPSYAPIPPRSPDQELGGSQREQSILPSRNGQTVATGSEPSVEPGRGLPTGVASGAVSGGAPSMNVEGLGRPGDKKLEGAQSPSVTIQKIAPPEIKVGKAAKIEIIVRNTGPVVAENVEVIESIPQGTTLVSTTPPTQTGQRGEIVWKVGELKPAEEAKLQVDLMPIAEGEIGSVAVVQFSSQASMRTIATKPELALELNSPKQVMIGGDVTVGIKISNPGTGAAERIVLHEVVPPGFQHPAGRELEFEVGTLKPGESRTLDLTLHAVQAGLFTNMISVSGDANLRAEQPAQIQVIAPALEVGINGPGLRYLERQAKYSVSVNNPGTATAKDVELVTRLPKGMQFVEASDMGHYDQQSHSVIWSLAELPANQAGSVMLTTLAAEPGEQRLRVEGRAAGGLSHTKEETTIVEGVAAVLFTVVDVDDPIEIGGQATYEIKVVNQGSKASSRVTVNAILPPEMKPVSAEGPSQYRIEGQRVVFEPMTRLAPKADITYRVVAQAVSPGDSRIKVLLQTDEMNEPVTKEESTRVYKD
ncbi:MAG: DUF11 domain-containing protein [Pirellulales bacterium]|nr:DUF11 domain-containing protein [Pirellulales bacterium]